MFTAGTSSRQKTPSRNLQHRLAWERYTRRLLLESLSRFSGSLSSPRGEIMFSSGCSEARPNRESRNATPKPVALSPYGNNQGWEDWLSYLCRVSSLRVTFPSLPCNGTLRQSLLK
ncbi:hypothetical protein FKM82_025246 [Ascaphus truei]